MGVLVIGLFPCDVTCCGLAVGERDGQCVFMQNTESEQVGGIKKDKETLHTHRRERKQK